MNSADDRLVCGWQSRHATITVHLSRPDLTLSVLTVAAPTVTGGIETLSHTLPGRAMRRFRRELADAIAVAARRASDRTSDEATVRSNGLVVYVESLAGSQVVSVMVSDRAGGIVGVWLDVDEASGLAAHFRPHDPAPVRPVVDLSRPIPPETLAEVKRARRAVSQGRQWGARYDVPPGWVEGMDGQ